MVLGDLRPIDGFAEPETCRAMTLQRCQIGVVFDSALAATAVEEALAGYFNALKVPLRDYTQPDAITADVNIFAVNIGGKDTFERVKGALKSRSGEVMFVLPSHNSDAIARLRQVHKPDPFVLPLQAVEFRAAVKAALNRPVEKTWAALEPTKRKALQSAVVSFEKCFDQVAHGGPVPIEDLSNTCRDIREAAALGGLDGWISALDNHHDYSFRHSMFVCGSLTYFAHALGVRGAELDQLTLGGLLHDIGKCRIPIEILDKPGKLDAREWETMKLHPVHSRDILYKENDLEKDLTAMAVYHHEKLDGSGYPDGLANGQINDHVRLTAIADVYSALIDKRAYKGSMSSEEALDMMSTFKGHLDLDLVREFRKFTLDRG